MEARDVVSVIMADVEETARRLLTKLDTTSWFQQSLKDDSDMEPPAKISVEYCVDSRRKQKIFYHQLQVIRFLLEFLEQSDTTHWVEGSAQVAGNKMSEVKQQWKSLKGEYLQQNEKIQELIAQVLQKVEALQKKKLLLNNILNQYQIQKKATEKQQQQKILEGLVGELGEKVKNCDLHIQLLESEVEKHQADANIWLDKVNRDLELCQLLDILQGVKLVSAHDDKLVLDLQTNDTTLMPKPQPLRLFVCWMPEGGIRIQSDCDVFCPAEILLADDLKSMTTALLEIQQCYQSQVKLLSELQTLKDRYAIDWLPKERKLLYLKAKVIYTLFVQAGYPTSGRVQLLSVANSKGSADPSVIKPPQENPSLSNWLAYLCLQTSD
uniref:ZW10 interactor n=1 Tax=Geotrypetes seraphini TaxID=260995 RepID=A0A6P8P735_GEOSA|nr:ZW10 interactor [Geotrypetes seraphini]